jgi:hypothetical protein
MEWEYLCARIVGGRFLLIDGKRTFEYENELFEKPVLDVLEVLGHYGWELVAIERSKSGAGTDAKNFYFKRPTQAVTTKS